MAADVCDSEAGSAVQVGSIMRVRKERTMVCWVQRPGFERQLNCQRGRAGCSVAFFCRVVTVLILRPRVKLTFKCQSATGRRTARVDAANRQSSLPFSTRLPSLLNCVSLPPASACNEHTCRSHIAVSRRKCRTAFAADRWQLRQLELLSGRSQPPQPRRSAGLGCADRRPRIGSTLNTTALAATTATAGLGSASRGCGCSGR